MQHFLDFVSSRTLIWERYLYVNCITNSYYKVMAQHLNFIIFKAVGTAFYFIKTLNYFGFTASTIKEGKTSLLPWFLTTYFLERKITPSAPSQ